MFKIKVFTPQHENDVEYFGSVVPVIGDKVNVANQYFTVIERTLFQDNPNYIIIKVQ